MLRKFRIIAASLFFFFITLLFLDFTGVIHEWMGWMAKIQFLPAILALNVGIIAALVLLTLIFGRIYCSVICPLGVFQDLISWIRGRQKKKNRFRFAYTKERKWLRLIVLVIFIILMAAGLNSIAILVAPYSAYGRIASNLFAPLYGLGNNLLAYFAERADSYAFYSTEVWVKSLPTFLIAFATFLIVAVLAWKGGRTYCNSICPVGTVLGYISKFSLFKISIDEDKCRACGLCGRQCRASCIDTDKHEVDYSRCVACMDCIDTCHEGAISYRFAPGCHPERRRRISDSSASPQNDKTGRRAFISTAALIGATSVLKAQDIKTDGGLAPVISKKAYRRDSRLTPAGSISHWNLRTHCTGCQLCVQACPNEVLRPSSSLEHLMQPEMSYERGWCRPGCTACSEVCPTTAIKAVNVEQKSSIQIGHAIVQLDSCIVNTEGVDCGNCAKHCPVGAIRLVRKDPDDMLSLRIPVVDTERCIGCGACEHLCPVRPYSAIHVEGNDIHRFI